MQKMKIENFWQSQIRQIILVLYQNIPYVLTKKMHTCCFRKKVIGLGNSEVHCSKSMEKLGVIPPKKIIVSFTSVE